MVPFFSYAQDDEEPEKLGDVIKSGYVLLAPSDQAADCAWPKCVFMLTENKLVYAVPRSADNNIGEEVRVWMSVCACVCMRVCVHVCMIVHAYCICKLRAGLVTSVILPAPFLLQFCNLVLVQGQFLAYQKRLEELVVNHFLRLFGPHFSLQNIDLRLDVLPL